MKKVHTVCSRDCPDACSLIFELNAQHQIHSVHADSDHPLTRGIICPRSARDRDRLQTNRIDAPYLKGSAGFKKISWARALDLVSQKLGKTLAEQGPQQILYLSYPGNTGMLANTYPKRLWNAIGATQTDRALCSKSGHSGISLHYGESYGANPLDISDMALVNFWGLNAAVSAAHYWQLARHARKYNQTKIVVVDPIETVSAQKADLWIRPNPQTDVALVYGVLNQLISDGRHDQDFLEKWTTGFEALRAEAAKWTPDRVRSVTGVSIDDLKALTELVDTHRPSLTMIGIGLQHCDSGADQVRAVALLPAVLGIHRGFFYGNGSAYDFDAARISGTSLAHQTSPKISQVALAESIAHGEFSVVYVSCMNPAMTIPNQNLFRRGLARPDLTLIVHETHWSETAQLADLVLPAPTFLEKEDIVIPDSHNRVQFSHQILPPVTDSRHEIYVMQEIAKRLDLNEPWLYEDALSVVTEILADAFEDGQTKDLIDGKRLKLRRKPLDHYATPSGRLEFYAYSAKRHGHAPLPVQKNLLSETDTFRLMASSDSKYTHTQFQEVYGNIPAVVHINREDATRFQISNGEEVIIENREGRLKLEAVISDILPAGVVWCPKEAADLDGAPQNCLISSRPQSLGKGPRFNSTRVKLRKA